MNSSLKSITYQNIYFCGFLILRYSPFCLFPVLVILWIMVDCGYKNGLFADFDTSMRIGERCGSSGMSVIYDETEEYGRMSISLIFFLY